MAASLHIATPADAPTADTAATVHHHLAMARAMACRLTEELEQAAYDLARKAEELADLGGATPVGIREHAQRIAVRAGTDAQVLTSLIVRAP
jgi:hypothetical protein